MENYVKRMSNGHIKGLLGGDNRCDCDVCEQLRCQGERARKSAKRSKKMWKKINKASKGHYL